MPVGQEPCTKRRVFLQLGSRSDLRLRAVTIDLLFLVSGYHCVMTAYRLFPTSLRLSQRPLYLGDVQDLFERHREDKCKGRFHRLRTKVTHRKLVQFI